jgi:hypothetical protein
VTDRRFLPMLAIPLGPTLVYLAGSFSAATFDITQWPDGQRSLLAFLGLIAIIPIGGVIYQFTGARNG